MAHPDPLVPPEGRFLTVSEVAALLHTSDRTIRRLIAEGRIRAVRMISSHRGHLRISRSALESFVAGAQVKTDD